MVARLSKQPDEPRIEERTQQPVTRPCSLIGTCHSGRWPPSLTKKQILERNPCRRWLLSRRKILVIILPELSEQRESHREDDGGYHISHPSRWWRGQSHRVQTELECVNRKDRAKQVLHCVSRFLEVENKKPNRLKHSGRAEEIDGCPDSVDVICHEDREHNSKSCQRVLRCSGISHLALPSRKLIRVRANIGHQRLEGSTLGE